MDPLDQRMMVNILTARMLFCRDPGGKSYLTVCRQGRLDGAPSAGGDPE